MPLDPQVQPLVDLVNAGAADAPSIWDQSVEERRSGYQALTAAVPAGPDVNEGRDESIPGPGGDIPIRIYRPQDAHGIVVFYHGGGWTIGDLDTHDEPCRQIALQSGATVVSVGYRLGPEARFPAAVVDSFAALTWAAENRDVLAEPGAKLAVCGDSAGGNLAAVMCLLARGLDGPLIHAQLLVYPPVDLRGTAGFESLATNGVGYILSAETIRWFQAQYLNDASDADDWRASPLLANSLVGLPPALVITAEFDPLRDEGAAYAAALRDAGVDVTHTNYEGMVHTFFQFGPLFDAGARSVTQVATAAKERLA